MRRQRRPWPRAALGTIALLGSIGALAVCAESGAPPAQPAPSVNEPVSGAITPATSLLVGRALHTITELRDERLLVVGGGNPETAIATAELIDPATHASRLIPMNVARLSHTATLLANGQVLIVGGGYGQSSEAARTAELFDPATERFTFVGPPKEPRVDHAAVLLGDGTVLILGGDVSGVGSTPTAGAEIYDPASRTFTRIASMLTPRRPYGTVWLRDGRVLIAGGTTTGKRIVSDAEIFVPATRQFVSAGPLATARQKHAGSLLPDGRVLIAGGSRGDGDNDRLATSEIFDPASLRFSPGPSMATARHKIASVAMKSGAILVIGGGASLTELFDPALMAFVPVARSGGIERFFPAAVELRDSTVLIAGGYTTGGSSASAWVFRR